MGFIAGLAAGQITNYFEIKSLLKAELFCALGILSGVGLASLSDMWLSGANIHTLIFIDFIPIVVPFLFNGLILIPILLMGYQAVILRLRRR